MAENLKPKIEFEAGNRERSPSPEKPAHNFEHQERDRHHEMDQARDLIEYEASDRVELPADEAAASHRITVKDKDRAYRHTMRVVQNRLSKPSKAFSRIIHQPVVERISEAAEQTVARPSALLGAGIFASVGLAIMLFFARRYGFSLSGSEFIALLVVGWLVGFMLDWLYKRIKQRV